MQIILAEQAGACYGVQRAIDMAERALDSGEGGEGEPAATSGASAADDASVTGALDVSRQGAVATLGPLIHNPAVVVQLAAKGLEQIDDVSEARPGQTVVIRSHGVAPDVIRSLKSQDCDIIDATCPHVMRAQRGAAALARQGCEVLVVGEAGHPEVEGIVAYAREAGADTHVISSIDDARDFLAKNTVEQAKLKTEGVACVMGSTTGAESSHAPESMGCALPGLASIRAADSTKPADASIDGGCDASAARSDDASDVLHSPSALSAELCCIGVVVQTTQRREAFEAILGTLRAGGLEPIVKDTICSATTERQQAADALSRRVDAMVVIGGRNSSNTTRLAEICASNCPTFHIEMPGELDAVDFSGIEHVGVTAGASTPESQINAVLDYLRQRDDISGDDTNGAARDPNGGLGRDSGHDHKGDAGRDSKDGADGAK